MDWEKLITACVRRAAIHRTRAEEARNQGNIPVQIAHETAAWIMQDLAAVIQEATGKGN